MVRYFCLVTDGDHGNDSHAYLEAFSRTTRAVRGIPIGHAGISDEERWYEIGHLFMTPLAQPFVNVVCAPSGMLMGTRTPLDLSRAEDLPEDLPLELRRVLDAGGGPRPVRATPSDLIYIPQTAIAGLYTVGCPNVAIVGADLVLDAREIAALARYDRVICPTLERTLALHYQGVHRAIYLPPDPELLARLIEEVCESGTTASTPSSLATDALRGTTSLRSIALAPRSRSSTSPREDSEESVTTRLRAPRRGTASSTDSSSAAEHSLTIRPSWPRRMWRSITRRLGL